MNIEIEVSSKAPSHYDARREEHLENTHGLQGFIRTQRTMYRPIVCTLYEVNKLAGFDTGKTDSQVTISFIYSLSFDLKEQISKGPHGNVSQQAKFPRSL